MTVLEAWNRLFSLSAGLEWIPIPEDIRQALGLDARLGLCGGILVTRVGASGITRCVNRINEMVARLEAKNG